MLIACPYCGPRDAVEFSYQGDANRVRPDPASDDAKAWSDYVFQRVNTAGPHREYWQHAGGCRSHLVVVRDTTTHEIRSVTYARAATVTLAAAPSETAKPRKAAAADRPSAPKRSAKPAPRSRKKPA